MEKWKVTFVGHNYEFKSGIIDGADLYGIATGAFFIDGLPSTQAIIKLEKLAQEV